MDFALYNVDKNYVNQLHQIDYRVEWHHGEHAKPYLGLILRIKKMNYYVPLSSPKPKHFQMKEALTFKKIIYGEELLAVLNINNMIPVPINLCPKIDIANISDHDYQNLLNKEYKICKHKQNDILKSAKLVYKFVCLEPEKHRRMLSYCCDFLKLEEACKNY